MADANNNNNQQQPADAPPAPAAYELANGDQIVEDELQKKGMRLPSKCISPLSNGYKPEVDCTAELKAVGTQRFQEIIGSFRWAIELGRVDILLETVLLSKHLALPREGHLE